MKSISQLPGHSRVWIYQSSREFSVQEMKNLVQKSEDFIRQWTSHENTMDAAIEFRYNRFVIIAADEQTAPASGCGIDKSLRFIQELEKQFSVSLLDRMQVAYLDGDTIKTCSLTELPRLFSEKKITEETVVFNNLVTNKKKLDTLWKQPLKNSWQYSRVSAGV